MISVSYYYSNSSIQRFFLKYVNKYMRVSGWLLNFPHHASWKWEEILVHSKFSLFFKELQILKKKLRNRWKFNPIKLYRSDLLPEATKNTFYQQFFLGPAKGKKKKTTNQPRSCETRSNLRPGTENLISYVFVRDLQGKEGDAQKRLSSKYFSNKITNCILTVL